MKKLPLLLFFLLAIIKMEAQQNRGIEKTDIRRGNPQTIKEIKTVEVNKPDYQRTADLKKLADMLVNAFAIDDVTWSRIISNKIEMPPRDIDKPFLTPKGMDVAKPSRVASNTSNTEETTKRLSTGDLKSLYPPGSKEKPSSYFKKFDDIEYFVWEYIGKEIPNANYIINISKIGDHGLAQQIFIGQIAENTQKNQPNGEEINNGTKKVAKFKAGKALADVVKRTGNPDQGDEGTMTDDGLYTWKVTETTTGISSEPSFFTISDADPCKIDIKPFSQGRKYCVGDTINLNWSGTTPTGQVTISLFDNTNNVVYAILATGIPNTGSFTYTIPSSLPCDPPRSWTLLVEDAEKLCLDRSDPFIIECCNQQSDCNCGKWLTNNVSIKGHLKKDAKDQKLKINFPTNFEKKVECGDKIELKRGMNYLFTAPNYVCNPENCDVAYTWQIIDGNGNILSGNGKTFNYTFNNHGTYKIIFTPICGGKRCAPCVIYVNIDKFTSLPNEPGPIIGDLSDIPITNPNDVTNPKTGKTWMNKNLGASQVATSPTDALAFGDLYQWGRLTDGHEKRTSSTTTTLSSSDVPGHGNFILHPNLPAPLSWNSPVNINLWQGVNGTNNPCPSGYRIPTDGELAAERLSWITPDAAGAFASPLKWTLAGNRSYVNGQIVNAGLRGSYWSSWSNGAMSSYMYINSGSSSPSNNYQTADGASVRCIKN